MFYNKCLIVWRKKSSTSMEIFLFLCKAMKFAGSDRLVETQLIFAGLFVIQCQITILVTLLQPYGHMVFPSLSGCLLIDDN